MRAAPRGRRARRWPTARKLLLGPLLAAEVEAVRPIAAEARVNVIAFATQTQVAGGNVFLMGFLPRQEVAREVSFARERGLRRFGALAPSTPYGRLMTDVLRDTVGSAGGTVTKVEYLNPDGSDVTAAVQRLVGPGVGPAPRRRQRSSSTRCCCRSAATS